MPYSRKYPSHSIPAALNEREELTEEFRALLDRLDRDDVKEPQRGQVIASWIESHFPKGK